MGGSVSPKARIVALLFFSKRRPRRPTRIGPHQRLDGVHLAYLIAARLEVAIVGCFARRVALDPEQPAVLALRSAEGAHSFVGMGSWIKFDVPAYVTVQGTPAEARGINVEGLRRRGFTPAQIKMIRQAFKLIYRRGLTLDEAIAELESKRSAHSELGPLIDSLRASGSRGIVR